MLSRCFQCVVVCDRHRLVHGLVVSVGRQLLRTPKQQSLNSRPSQDNWIYLDRSKKEGG